MPLTGLKAAPNAKRTTTRRVSPSQATFTFLSYLKVYTTNLKCLLVVLR